MIKKIAALISKIPREQRKKLDGLRFIVDKDSFQIVQGGSFARGQYFKDNSIVFYEAFIHSDEELKEVLRHELCHHFGMNEEQVRRWMK